MKQADGSATGTTITTTTTTTTPPGFFTNEPFSKLPISDPTKKALANLKFEKMTHIQSLAIPPLLAGKDVVGAAKTGSGKTLVSRRWWWR